MAENGLRLLLSGAFQRAWRGEKFATLLLLFSLLTAAVAGVTGVLTGPDWGVLWQSLLLGLLLGWGLAILRTRAWKSILLILLAGLLFSYLTAGGLGATLGAVISEILRLPRHTQLSHFSIQVDASWLRQAAAEVLPALLVVTGRAASWLQALWSGQPAFDPVAAGIVWSLLVGWVAGWAGWMVEAGRNALLAVLPAIVLNLATLSYGRAPSITLHLTLGAALALVAVVQYDRREQEWNAGGVAYPPRKDRQVGSAALGLAAGIVVVAALLSSITFQRISHWVNDLGRPSSPPESGLAKSLGVRQASAVPDSFTPQRSPGLPRDLLIGSGPELSSELVMSVGVKNQAQLSRAGQIPTLYWRDFTYDLYTGHGWSTSGTQQVLNPPDQTILPANQPEHELIQQVVRPANGGDLNVYAAGDLVSLDSPARLAWRDANDLFGAQLTSSGAYQVSSLVAVPDETSLRTAGQNYPQWVIQRYLTLPEELPGRVKELAIQLTATEPTPYERARAIERYLRSFPYSLDVPRPPSNQDLVDFFLTDLRKGYCDYYASAMVVLARAAGIPARLAVGYATGTYNLNSHLFLVTQAEAHSWAEVYFPGIGWVPFEPTAAQPAIDRSKEPTPLPSPLPPAVTGSHGLNLPSRWSRLVGYTGLALLIAAGMVWAGVDEWHLQRLEAQPAAREIYRRMRRYGRLLGVTAGPGTTPFEFADTLNGRLAALAAPDGGPARGKTSPGTQSLARQVVRLAYRSMAGDQQAARQLVDEWKAVRWQYRAAWVKVVTSGLVQNTRKRLAGLIGN